MGSTSQQQPLRSLLLYLNRAHEPAHERVVHEELARRLAVLQGMQFAGVYEPETLYPQAPYLVPSDTVIGLQEARALGLRDEQDLFGGVAPQAFVPTKAITHPLPDAQAFAPPGWSRRFGERVAGAVLPGFTAFSLPAARSAARQLLAQGAVRIKPVRATGGRGQSVIASVDELDALLARMEAAELAVYGLTLEQDLSDVTTFSVGQVRVAAQLISYYGTQRLTADNQGELVYGGSDLLVARGGFAELLRLDLPDAARRAVSQAQCYDRAALECFAGLYASRRNYDVLQGRDAAGQWRSGVLEQSWRIGGASSAEIIALERFQAEPEAVALKASSIELFGEQHAIPAHAELMYRGLDAQVGFVSKFATVEAHDQH